MKVTLMEMAGTTSPIHRGFTRGIRSELDQIEKRQEKSYRRDEL
jgi:hypothetical protein